MNTADVRGSKGIGDLEATAFGGRALRSNPPELEATMAVRPLAALVASETVEPSILRSIVKE